jgi:phosphate transport system substrate-binding protein
LLGATGAVGLAAIDAFVVGCRRRSASLDTPTVTLHGAGATFPAPLYERWAAEFASVDPRARINYQPVGSGQGIRQILDRTTDFGATDSPLTDEQLARANAKILHVPMTVGAVAVTYNLPGLAAPLRIDGNVLAAIFLGEVTRWNDPRLAAQNPGAALPDRAIAVVHRADGSGTSAVFTSYMTQANDVWASRVGSSTTVAWPVGVGAKGSDGIANYVRTTEGAIGYLELVYATRAKLGVASMGNRRGNFVLPSRATTSAAAESVRDRIPDDLRLSLVDADGDDAYPIAAFSYIVVYEDQRDPVEGAQLARFLWWCIHEGQRSAAALEYAPLPAPVVRKAEEQLRALQAGGTPLLANL